MKKKNTLLKRMVAFALVAFVLLPQLPLRAMEQPQTEPESSYTELAEEEESDEDALEESRSEQDDEADQEDETDQEDPAAEQADGEEEILEESSLPEEKGTQPELTSSEAELFQMEMDVPIIQPAAITAPDTISNIFPDEELAAFIAQHLGKSVGDTVTQDELNTITSINLSGELHDIEGAQYLNNLNELRIANAQLTERFPEEFLTDIYPDLQIYVANGQRYTNPLIVLDNPGLQQVIDQIPPLMLQIAENSNGAQVGTWIIRNQYNGEIASIPAVDGTELDQFNFADSGTYNIELLLGSNVWLGLDQSQYFFPVEFLNDFGSLSGTVRDENGPLADVIITLSTGETTRTDENGQYSFISLLSGDYTVTASLEGYDSQTQNATVVAEQNTVVDFFLVSSYGGLIGYVLDELTNELIEGAAVTLYAYDENGGLEEIAGPVLSNEDGSFGFENLPVGTYFVSASKDGYNPGTRPGIPVSSGIATEAYVYLLPITRTIYGVVTDAVTEELLPGVTIEVNGRTVTTDEDGAYEIEVYPGTYTVNGSLDGYESASEADVDVTSEERVEVNLALQPQMGTLTGYVYRAPPSDPEVPIEDALVILSNGMTAQTNADGEYTIEDVPVGDYTATASAGGYASQQAAVTIALNQEAEQNFYLPANPVELLVRVYYEGTTTGVPEVEITLDDGHTGTTGPDGSYLFSLEPATYIATAELENYTVSPASAEAVLVPNSERQILTFYVTPDPGELTGVIIDLMSREEIIGAEVTLAPDLREQSGNGGFYDFENLQPATYTITVTAPGYVTVQRTGVVIDPGQRVVANFGLLRAVGTIVGTARDTSGNILPNVTVTIVDENNQSTTITTDENGNYVQLVNVGDYTLTASLDGYYGDAGAAQVEEGQSTVVNFVLRPLEGRLTGTVVDDLTDELLETATVVIRGQNIDTITLELEDGSFSIDLPPGTYTVTASYPNYSTEQQTVVIVSLQAEPVELRLDPDSGGLEGYVTDAVTGRPIAGAAITVGAAVIVVYTNMDGYYSVALPEGDYTATASASGYSSEDGGATIEPGQTAQQDFALTPLPGTLSGRVTDYTTGLAIANATITIVGTDGSRYTVPTDANGNYSIELPIGSYSITATANGYGTQQTSASIVSQNTTVVNFRLVPGPGVLRGMVYDTLTLQPIPYATVFIQPSNISLVADENGYYEVSLTADNYTVSASAQGYESTQLYTRVQTGVSITLNIPLVPLPGFIVGTVTNAVTGETLEGVTITITGLTRAVTSTETDGSGSYSSLQTPGEYSVQAELDGYASQIKNVTVISSIPVRADFELVPTTGVMEGVVTDSKTGLPIPGATVVIGPEGFTVIADENGYYSISLAPGDYTVTASAAGYVTQTGAASVSAGITTVLDIALDPVEVPPGPPPTSGGGGEGSGGGTGSNSANGGGGSGAASLTGNPPTGDNGYALYAILFLGAVILLGALFVLRYIKRRS